MKSFKQFLYEMAASDFKVKKVNGVYKAYDKKTRKSAAGAIAWKEPHKDNPETEVDTIFKMATNPEFRRKGAMTAIHQHIEKETGRQLHPSSALTDDGFNFWKKYRPEAVKNDLRNHKESLMGKKVTGVNGTAKITRVGSDGATATYDHDNYTTFYLNRNKLKDQGHLP